MDALTTRKYVDFSEETRPNTTHTANLERLLEQLKNNHVASPEVKEELLRTCNEQLTHIETTTLSDLDVDLLDLIRSEMLTYFSQIEGQQQTPWHETVNPRHGDHRGMDFFAANITRTP